MTETIVFALLWFGTGLLSWPIQAGFVWNVAKEYPTLGTQAEQWKQNRMHALKYTAFITIFGPVGLAAAIVAWLIEGCHGFKLRWNA